MSSLLLTLAALICVSGSASALLEVSAAARSLLAAPPGIIPPGCTGPGLALQTDCAPEISAANTYFGNALKGGKSASGHGVSSFNSAGVTAYLQNAKAPSAACCKASCDFNNNYCSCYPALLNIIKGFTANDIGIYYSTAGFIAKKCAYGAAFYDKTCPADPPTAKPSPNKC
ncbi:MAG: hypothetical protein WDW38_001022 [Sanguina aurantia]